MIIELNDSNFDDAIKSKKTILVEFWAPWCNPCKMMNPILEELSQSYDVGKVNIDDCSDIAIRLGIKSVPTMIIFSNGHQIKRTVGAFPLSILKRDMSECTKTYSLK